MVDESQLLALSRRWGGRLLGRASLAFRDEYVALGLLSAALATNEALDFGLVPQWRSRIENTASRRTAARLGFVEVGSQTTVLLAAAPA